MCDRIWTDRQTDCTAAGLNKRREVNSADLNGRECVTSEGAKYLNVSDKFNEKDQSYKPVIFIFSFKRLHKDFFTNLKKYPKKL